ncbi:MAG: hypothetical protein JKY65_09285 [Planctomycetes bacterium]|nr:hypothetical protein [Planctomycetota bacterium]
MQGNLSALRDMARRGVVMDGGLLEIAVQRWRKYPEVAKWLIDQGKGINTENAHGSSMLHLCVMYGAHGTVPLMLAAGADPTKKNRSRETPRDIITQSTLQFRPRSMFWETAAILEAAEIEWPKTQMVKVGEWRPRTHRRYPNAYRAAMRALVLLAKS